MEFTIEQTTNILIVLMIIMIIHISFTIWSYRQLRNKVGPRGKIGPRGPRGLPGR
jgi:cytochrome bd-type quinol oxidase subunit 2